MEYRTLGGSGLRVSSMCLGTMALGAWGNSDRNECSRIINEALESGINFIDTADIYSQGESEEIVGEAISGRRDEVVLATKVHGPMSSNINDRGNSRRWIIKEVENSLRRLGTDWIDLYQIHHPDPNTDIDETLGALTDLIRDGKVRCIGSSAFSADELVEAQWVAERRVRERFRCEQPPYSIFVREIERYILPVCQKYGLGVIVWGTVNGGWLTGKYRRGKEIPGGSRGDRTEAFQRYDMRRNANQVKLDLVEDLAELASEEGCSLSQMATAWSLAHPAITSAIVGPRRREQLTEVLGGADVRLSEDTLDRIDEIVPPGDTIDSTDTAYTPEGLLKAARRWGTVRGDEEQQDPLGNFVRSLEAD